MWGVFLRRHLLLSLLSQELAVLQEELDILNKKRQDCESVRSGAGQQKQHLMRSNSESPLVAMETYFHGDFRAINKIHLILSGEAPLNVLDVMKLLL